MGLKRGIEKAVERMVIDLKGLSQPVKGEMIAQVGTISANADAMIGKIIADAMDKVGKDGVITAVEEGIVPRGGVALLRASASLESFARDPSLEDDERVGVELVRRASEEPTRWIAQNAGVEGSIVTAKIKESTDKHWGFDAQSGQYTDLVNQRGVDRIATPDDRGPRVGDSGESKTGGASEPRHGRLLTQGIPGGSPGSTDR